MGKCVKSQCPFAPQTKGDLHGSHTPSHPTQSALPLLTHPTIDLPTPPALLPLLVEDLDDVTLLKGQFRSVPGTEVIAGFGGAKILGASSCEEKMRCLGV